jgi:hypothetical protein
MNRRLPRLLVGLAAFLVLAHHTGQAQAQFLFPGGSDGGAFGSPFTLPIQEAVLTPLPTTVHGGDVVLLDADGSRSDVLRFSNDPFSGITPQAGDVVSFAYLFPAQDFPPSFQLSTNAVTLAENESGATLYAATDLGVTYTYLLNSPEAAPVAEPPSLLLLACGGLLLGGWAAAVCWFPRRGGVAA